jgi:bisphosphoglycerate-dependent phosphoglycerate mutase family 1
MVKKKTYKVYVFRHGRTVYNVKGLFTGWKKTKLTWRGKRDAKKVAKKLKNVKFQVAFKTRLPRSMETLKYILKYHPECKKIITDDRMIERSYGILEGTTHKQFVDKIGKRSYNLRVEGDAIENLDPKQRKKVEKFLGEREYHAVHRGYNVAVPKGESFADVEKRVRKFIEYLKKYIKKHKVNVVISSHGNSIRLFRKIMEGASRKEAVSWFIPYDMVFVYKIRV